MSVPIVAIVGRPNVGKSTLFNRIIKKRVAIVDKTPGVTRDRNYMEAEFSGIRFLLIDTGGFEPVISDGILRQMREQTELAVEESDAIIFLVDGQEGITHIDREIFKRLRHSQKPVYLAVNKIDDPGHESRIYEYYEMGVDKVFALSAEHDRGVVRLLEEVTGGLPSHEEEPFSGTAHKIAVVGKPNTGKSTLINLLTGTERLIVHDTAGTTRDSIDTLVEQDGVRYLFIDTAGIRKKGRVSMKLEKYSVIMALKSIDRSDVCLLMIDATRGVTEQDTKIAGYISEAGRGCVIVINKWDILKADGANLEDSKEMVREKIKFLSYAPIIFISATTGLRQKNIFPALDRVAADYHKQIPTTRLNKAIQDALKHRPPSAFNGKAVKIYYSTQVKNGPPTFILFANFADGITDNYSRYLQNYLRKEFDFTGVPLRFVIKSKRDT